MLKVAAGRVDHADRELIRTSLRAYVLWVILTSLVIAMGGALAQGAALPAAVSFGLLALIWGSLLMAVSSLPALVLDLIVVRRLHRVGTPGRRVLVAVGAASWLIWGAVAYGAIAIGILGDLTPDPVPTVGQVAVFVALVCLAGAAYGLLQIRAQSTLGFATRAGGLDSESGDMRPR